LEGCGRGLIEVLCRNLPEETEENLSQGDRCPGRDSNRATYQYESRPLLLRHRARSDTIHDAGFHPISLSQSPEILLRRYVTVSQSVRPEVLWQTVTRE
jgi:hypothetical protein